MTRAIGYVRVSTEKQAAEGVSLEAQEKKIRAMCEVQGAELLEIISDDESGKNLNRPGMKNLLDLVDNKAVDVVIVAKLDRLTRSIRDLVDIIELFGKKDVSLVSVNESLDTKSASGRLVINIMACVSQWEREVIGERTRDALAHKKANGERVGTVPYGFKVDMDGKTLLQDVDEQMVIYEIVRYRNAGYSRPMIAKFLNENQYTTRSGEPWNKEYVRNVMKNR